MENQVGRESVEQHKMLGKAWERLGTLEGKTPGMCHVSLSALTVRTVWDFDPPAG